MANLRDIRRRIKSVKNTAQITKAMQMVAASKMRKAQQGFFDEVPVEKIKIFQARLAEHLESVQNAVLTAIRGEAVISDLTAAKLKEILTAFKRTFV